MPNCLNIRPRTLLLFHSTHKICRKSARGQTKKRQSWWLVLTALDFARFRAHWRLEAAAQSHSNFLSGQTIGKTARLFAIATDRSRRLLEFSINTTRIYNQHQSNIRHAFVTGKSFDFFFSRRTRTTSIFFQSLHSLKRKIVRYSIVSSNASHIRTIEFPAFQVSEDEGMSTERQRVDA